MDAITNKNNAPKHFIEADVVVMSVVILPTTLIFMLFYVSDQHILEQLCQRG